MRGNGREWEEVAPGEPKVSSPLKMYPAYGPW